MDAKEKIRENYYRRMAKRLHLELKKSRAKKWSLDNLRGYAILDPHFNTIVAGENYDMSLDQVAEFLEEAERVIQAPAGG